MTSAQQLKLVQLDVMWQFTNVGNEGSPGVIVDGHSKEKVLAN